jgi:hypothetical protein
LVKKRKVGFQERKIDIVKENERERERERGRELEKENRYKRW